MNELTLEKNDYTIEDFLSDLINSNCDIKASGEFNIDGEDFEFIRIRNTNYKEKPRTKYKKAISFLFDYDKQVILYLKGGKLHITKGVKW